MRQTLRNQTVSIILIFVQKFGRYEFYNGSLEFEILVKKAPLLKKNEIKLGRFHLKKHNCFYNIGTLCIYTAIFSKYAVEA
jgi:hypothetical protein